MQDNVRLFGIGSLGWMIVENDIPTDEIIPFVMRPEHGHLLADYLAAMGPAAVEKLKPSHVRHLIISRQYDNSFNAVLILHGLVAKDDKAASAIFTADERIALLGVPDDYSSGRNVLVNLGLLPTMSNVPPLSSGRETAWLISLLALIFKEWDAAAQTDPRVINLSQERRTIVLLARTLLFVHITRRVLRQVYGAEVSAVFMTIVEGESVKGAVEWFDHAADKLAASNSPTPIDFMLFHEVMDLNGLAPQTEEAFEHDREWMDMGAEWLNHERVILQQYLRFIFRWIGVTPPEIRSAIDDDITAFIRDAYVRYGDNGGFTQNEMLPFEDWIGIDA